jgi:hypothetical protein
MSDSIERRHCAAGFPSQIHGKLSAGCLDFYHKPVKTARRKFTNKRVPVGSRPIRRQEKTITGETGIEVSLEGVYRWPVFREPSVNRFDA